MTVEVVPEQRRIICDECKATSLDGRFKMRAHVKFSGSALDIYGDPAASANFEFDLCDKCAVEFFNEWRAKIK